MIRVALYSNNIEEEEARESVGEPCELFRRNPDVWTDDQYEPFDAVVVDLGCRHSGEIKAVFEQRETRVIGCAKRSRRGVTKTVHIPDLSSKGDRFRVVLFEDVSLLYSRAFMDGVNACGDEAIGYNQYLWTPNDHIECDVAVVIGGQSIDKAIRERFEGMGVPVLVVELGHINRAGSRFEATGGTYFQFGPRINWLPECTCPPDRRKALGITSPGLCHNQAGPILLLGQKDGDAQHEVDSFDRWHIQMVNAIQNVTNREILWRPHPQSGEFKAGDYGPIEDVFGSVHSVVTHNSNAGLKAILAGVPVVSDPCAFYHPLTIPLEEIEKPKPPAKMKFYSLINRVCYAQWTVDEFATGEPWRWMKKNYLDGVIK